MRSNPRRTFPQSVPDTDHLPQRRVAGGVETRLPNLLLCSLLLLAPALKAQSQGTGSTTLLSVPPKTWATQCADQETRVIQHPGSYLRYRMHVIDEKGDKVRDQIETPEGSVARLILHDGKPVTPEEDSAERDRLTALAGSPATYARHVKNEQANKKMGVDVLKLMPDAMLWTYAPGQPAPAQSNDLRASTEFVVLDFKPDPNWSPPSLPSQALTGLEGRIWIDAETHQLLRIQGTLVRPVNVGWGVLAHLYPGGTIALDQERASADRWIANHVDEQLVVRALMLKTIRQRLVYDTSSYQLVPPMSYQQAIRTLLDTPLPAH